jgi:hypothetical protein
MFLHIKQIVVLEICKTSEVETGQNGYYLAIVHLAGTVSTLPAVSGTNLVFFDFLCIFFTKIVCHTENFSNFVRGKHIHDFCFDHWIFNH